MSNSINKNLYDRLVIQSFDADNQNNQELSSLITKIASSQDLRSDLEENRYQYAREQLHNDCKELIAQAALRIADYCGNNKFDLADLLPQIEEYSYKIFAAFTRKLSLEPKIGHYEPKLPGEER